MLNNNFKEVIKMNDENTEQEEVQTKDEEEFYNTFIGVEMWSYITVPEE